MTSAPAKKAGTVPSHVPPHLVRDFSYRTDAALLRDPYTVLDRLHDTRAFWSSRGGGFWVLTRAEDIQNVFKEPHIFSNDTPDYRMLAAVAASSAPEGCPTHKSPAARGLIPLGMDPPEHGIYRRVVAQRFTPKATEEMRPGITKICVDLIEPLVHKGRCDFAETFARPFPTAVFNQLMGLPEDDSEKFIGWANAVLHGTNIESINAAKAEIVACLTALIEERSIRPTADLVSYILAGKIEDRSVTKEETLGFCMLLFLAGLDTVTTTLGLIFHHLAEHPEIRRRLVDHPELLPEAIEELLRLHAPVNPARVVTRDTEFAGVQMKAGDEVLLITSLAARDPERFADAPNPKIDRKPNDHTAFGTGPHVCLGIHLARLELSIALKEWLARIPDFSTPKGFEVSYRGGGIFGLRHLDLEWPIRG